MDAGMIIKDQDNGWHIANDFIVEIEPKKVTPIDIADDFIRKMIDVK
jgi:hypothetical protein